jgi:competence ComEA-like helix-hairpin-helix protein
MLQHNTVKERWFQPMIDEPTTLRNQLRLLRGQTLLVFMMFAVFLYLSASATRDYLYDIQYLAPNAQLPVTFDFKIEINSAAWMEFAELPGVGEALARRIVAYRERHGPFREIEELDHVPGLGKVTLERIRPMIRRAEQK